MHYLIFIVGGCYIKAFRFFGACRIIICSFIVKYKYNENWRERDKVYEEMPDAILRILFHRC